MPQVWWTDKVNWSSMLYKGDQVYLDGIHSMFAKLEQDIWDNWKDSILQGVCLDPITLGDLTEDLTRCDMGYWMVDETLGGNSAIVPTLTCQISILPDEAQGHLDYAHADAKIHIDAGALEEAVELMQVMDTFQGLFE
ncbi:hypothetical protein BOTBODRAFT_173643 [Botryobasidium botryosum FD-172 SS1]|uniref:Uncharacterized protein n=1 Tax=Botryobasidium botryosum (strain FD-172 SS1) TaxID=930990 RepID=A0A067MWR9_BOTB1|nr:hypothetical protein BOTBODRAFT_173643 [Botryobasidium botryosum FD-172 SS1]